MSRRLTNVEIFREVVTPISGPQGIYRFITLIGAVRDVPIGGADGSRGYLSLSQGGTMTVTRIRTLAVLPLVGILSAGGAAFAQQTQAVTGTFNGAPVNVMTRTCVGADGNYLELRGHFSGAIVSSDPRLTGTLDFMAEEALVNSVTGLGTFRGRFQVSNASGAQTASGQFFTVVTEGGLNHGFALGRVMNAGGAAEEFFGTFNSVLDASLNVAGQFGGVGDPRLPAVVQGGTCSGRFTRVP
jgi:hypothetical protein